MGMILFCLAAERLRLTAAGRASFYLIPAFSSLLSSTPAGPAGRSAAAWRDAGIKYPFMKITCLCLVSTVYLHLFFLLPVAVGLPVPQPYTAPPERLRLDRLQLFAGSPRHTILSFLC